MNISIPPQLRKPEFRFCKIQAKTKKPFENKWQENGYKHDSEELKQHLALGGNYGVIGGYGNLRMLDLDDPVLADDIGERTKTFQVRTGSGGRHLYFVCDYETNHVLKDGKGEFRANNWQCVGAGSTHPNGNKYEVLNPDSSVQTITEDELMQIISPYLKEENKPKDKPSPQNEPDNMSFVVEELIQTLKKSTHGKIFNQLYEKGEWTDTYESQSEADFALCATIARKNQDPRVIDAIFRKSKLYREKWEREDYRESTITKAVEYMHAKATKKTSSNIAWDIETYFNSVCVDKYCDQHGEEYFLIQKGDKTLQYSASEGSFSKQLLHDLKHELQLIVPKTQLASVLDTHLHECSLNPKELDVRFARDNDSIFIDCCDDDQRAIKVSANGWEYVQNPLLFRRYKHMKEFIVAKDASELKEGLDYMFKFANIQDEQMRILFKVHLVLMLVPKMPTCIWEIFGTEGSGKTTFVLMVRSLIDPSNSPLVKYDRKNVSDLPRKANKNAVVAFDNLTHVSEEFNDWLARTVTGESDDKRKLYTDDEDITFTYQRNVLLNGRGINGIRSDIMDRKIICEVHRIPEEQRKPEEKLWADFHEKAPYLRAELLRLLSEALKIKSSIVLDKLPRMADYVKLGAAVAQVMGVPPHTYVKYYNDNLSLGTEESIFGDPFLHTLVRMLDDDYNSGNQVYFRSGYTPTALFKDFEYKAQECGYEKKEDKEKLPANATMFGRMLRMNEAALHKKNYAFTSTKSGERKYFFHKVRDDDPLDTIESDILEDSE